MVAEKAPGPGKGHATVPDNCQLIELTDQTVITNIRRRYEQNDIYTFTGNIHLLGAASTRGRSASDASVDEDGNPGGGQSLSTRSRPTR